MTDDRVEAPALAVPIRDGESVRRRLLEEGLLRLDLKVARGGDAIFLPLTRELTEYDGHSVERRAFEPTARGPASWQEVAARHVPTDLVALLPSAFDQIGHVVVLKLPPELVPHARALGDAILASVKSARSVAVDRGVTGELRIRDLDVVAGDPDTLTTHHEFGVRLMVDPARAYFSPRLATERKRVADIVRDGERVVDLFAGVGPFVVVIAKHARPARVDGVDLNPDAVGLMEENARLNRVEDVVHAHHADARAWAAAHPGVADRVVTNIPHTAADFAESVLTVLKPEGGTWHHHAILSPDGVDAHVAQLRERARRAGRDLALAFSREVRTYSPTERHYALDLRVDAERG